MSEIAHCSHSIRACSQPSAAPRTTFARSNLRLILFLSLGAALTSFVLNVSCGGMTPPIEEPVSTQPVPTATVHLSPLRLTATAKAQTRGGTSVESELARLTRDADSIVSWISGNADALARCVAAGTIDWSLYELRLKLFATILEESGKDAIDGRLDSYSTYEIERNIDGARQTIRELESKCGIR